VFDENWTELILHQKTVVSNSLKFMSAIVMEKYKQLDNEDHIRIWKRLFATCFELIIQPKLYLDIYPLKKRTALQIEYENIIRNTVYIIQELWEALGYYKHNFVSQFVGDVIAMSMHSDPCSRRKSIEIFRDMITCFVRDGSKSLSDEYKLLELTLMVLDKFDYLIESGSGDCAYKNDFKKIMQETDVHRNAAERNFVSKLNLYLALLLQYYFYKNQVGKENLIRSILMLMQLTRDFKHYELYLRLIYRLFDIHIAFRNYAEAAMTLKLHADLLEWNTIIITPMSR
jgi:hypothetical protein